MHKWQILISIFVLFFVCEEVTAGDKEDVLASWNAVKAAWMIGDVDAAKNTFQPSLRYLRLTVVYSLH